MKNLLILVRPKTSEVLHHPLFWDSDTRLSFICDASEWIENDRKTRSGSNLLKAIESVAPIAFGGNWKEVMDNAFIDDICCYRPYNFESVRDLLRVMRNKYNHYLELQEEIQVYIIIVFVLLGYI